jgi:hypothetical protein
MLHCTKGLGAPLVPRSRYTAPSSGAKMSQMWAVHPGGFLPAPPAGSAASSTPPAHRPSRPAAQGSSSRPAPRPVRASLRAACRCAIPFRAARRSASAPLSRCRAGEQGSSARAGTMTRPGRCRSSRAPCSSCRIQAMTVQRPRPAGSNTACVIGGSSGSENPSTRLPSGATAMTQGLLGDVVTAFSRRKETSGQGTAAPLLPG